MIFQNKHLHRTLLYKLLLPCLVFLGVFLLLPGKAHAATPNDGSNCSDFFYWGQYTAAQSDWVGIVFETKAVNDADGTETHFNRAWHVQQTDNDAEAAVVNIPSYSAFLTNSVTRVRSGDFSTGETIYCNQSPSNNYTTTIGNQFTGWSSLGLGIAPIIGDRWSLDCASPATRHTFVFSMDTSVPAGLPSGGSWRYQIMGQGEQAFNGSTATIQPNNGMRYHIVVSYHYSQVTPPPTGTPTPPPPPACPGVTGANNSIPGWQSNIPISLPDTSPNDPPPSGIAVGPPGGSTTYSQRVRANRTNVTGTNDISSGGNRYPPPLVSQSYQQANVSYQPFIDNYPYDQNQGSVTYDSYYNTHTWTGTSTWSWEIIGWNWVCTANDPNTGACTDGFWDPVWGWVLTSNSWSDGGAGPDQTVSSTANGPVMQPCFYRAFDITPSVGNATFDNNEAPTQVTFSFSTSTVFTLPDRQTSLRQPFAINHNITTSYVVYRADGSTITYPLGRTGGGSSDAVRCGNYVGPSGNVIVTGNNGPSDNVACNYQETYSAIIPPLQAGDIACIKSVRVSPAMGLMDVAGNATRVDVGSRQADGTVDRGSANCTQQLVDQPYFRAYSGDVIAGSGFMTDTGCTQTAGATILAWNRGPLAKVPQYPGDPYGGSGVQLAAFALGTINNFASAAGNTQTSSGIYTAPKPPKGLTFANDSSTGTWGGQWDSGNVACAPNYMATATGADPGAGPWNISNVSGTFNRPGNLIIGDGNPQNIGLGTKLTIYASGDVAIVNNIAFGNNGNANPSYTGGISTIPSLRIIARNIFIAPNVTQIDGILIAQPDAAGSGGALYTCSSPANSFALPNDAEIADTNTGCRANQLTIYGAVIAQHIGFLRSSGSLRDARNAEGFRDTNGTNPRGMAAERIVYSPEVWLGVPATEPPQIEPYEAFTTLPPIL